MIVLFQSVLSVTNSYQIVARNRRKMSAERFRNGDRCELVESNDAAKAPYFLEQLGEQIKMNMLTRIMDVNYVHESVKDFEQRYRFQ